MEAGLGVPIDLPRVVESEGQPRGRLPRRQLTIQVGLWRTEGSPNKIVNFCRTGMEPPARSLITSPSTQERQRKGSTRSLSNYYL